MRRPSSKPGMTLVELMVVVVIISILTLIVSVQLASARRQGRDARRKADLHQVDEALGLYATYTGSKNGKPAYVGGSTVPPRPVFGSAFDANYNHTNTYWTGGCETVKPGCTQPLWDTGLYDSLVGKGYIGALPRDPMNWIKGSQPYLQAGPLMAESYMYSTVNQGITYMLSDNLEGLSAGLCPEAAPLQSTEQQYAGNYCIVHR